MYRSRLHEHAWSYIYHLGDLVQLSADNSIFVGLSRRPRGVDEGNEDEELRLATGVQQKWPGR
jgi:hypothetical protein